MAPGHLPGSLASAVHPWEAAIGEILESVARAMALLVRVGQATRAAEKAVDLQQAMAVKARLVLLLPRSLGPGLPPGGKRHGKHGGMPWKCHGNFRCSRFRCEVFTT